MLERLHRQKYPIHKILVMNTEEAYWNRVWETEFPLVEVHHLKKQNLTTAEPESVLLSCRMRRLWFL